MSYAVLRRWDHAAVTEALVAIGGGEPVEVSFDGKRVYLTNSLYTSLDEQFYPDGIKGWMAKIQVDGPTGEMSVDTRFLPDFGGMRPHQTRLHGGDASSDSFCYA